MAIIQRSSVRILFAVAMLTASAAIGRCDELTETEFQQLSKLLTPAENDLWRTIPWKIALLDAQRTALQENKPIFIWAMDGHPLGCT